MLRTIPTGQVRMFQSDPKLTEIRNNMARAMIGRIVLLSAGACRTAHGLVTAVIADSGIPKLVVGGAKYDLNQVLTVTPAALGC